MKNVMKSMAFIMAAMLATSFTAFADDAAMESTFSGCKNVTDLNALKSWKPKAVTTMDSMFSSCTLLSDISSIASWDTSNVTSMSYMFYKCTSLEDASPIQNWNISNVTSRTDMFTNAPCGDIFASAA